MDCREKSMENVRNWLMKSRKGYEKMEGSSYEGFIYKMKSVALHKEFTIDLRFVKNGSMKFEMYPGIMACSKDFVPVMAKYCLETGIPVGYLHVDDKAKEVVYTCESFCVDDIITPETMTRMEEIGEAVIGEHYDNLQKLASGNWIGMSLPHRDHDLIADGECDLQTLASNVRNSLLSNQGRNAVCESICSNDLTKFYLQNYARDDTFVIEIRFLRGFLVMKGIYGRNGIVCPAECKMTVAEYFRKYNEVHMLGGMKIGTDEEPCYFEICTSLLNSGNIGPDTIDAMEGIVLNALSGTAPALQKLAMGFPLSEDDQSVFHVNNMIKDALKNKVAHDLFGSSESREEGFPQGLLELIKRAEGEKKALEEDRDDDLFLPDEETITMDEYLECLDEDGMNDSEEKGD